MKKIVLVDDVHISNFIMKKLIGNVVPDSAVFDFTDSGLALSNLESINPDIIFLDLNMPKLNGWQFLDKMKEKNLNYKVIIVSSSTSDVDKKQSVGYNNVIAYFSKPPQKADIAAALKKFI